LAADDKRQMHMVAYLKTGPTARQDGGWRHPEATLDDFLSAERYQAIARTLEAAKFDGCFFADLLGLQDIHRGSYDTVLRGGGQVSYLDPMVVLPVMAAARQVMVWLPVVFSFLSLAIIVADRYDR
jgi:hypothetical protein